MRSLPETDEDTRVIPKSVTMGQVVKVVEEKGPVMISVLLTNTGIPIR